MSDGASLDVGEAHALALDAADPLRDQRAAFRLPTDTDGQPLAYLAGNSLGVQPLAARDAVMAILEQWGELGVDAWFAPGTAWLDVERTYAEATARIVGARPDEITTANTLSVNLHLLLAALYRPRGQRTRILIDAPTFPSDRYVVESQLRHHGLDPATHLVTVQPRDGETTLRPDDLEAAIHQERDRLAVALLAGINYATGQALDIPRSTAAVHEAGGLAIWDLAHAAGNIELALHDAGVDAAAWCTYKYLNGGPGAVAQLFVHERHHGASAAGALHGWWGSEPSARFRMGGSFAPAPGADAFRVSTPPILSVVPVGVSLAMVDGVGMPALRAKSIALTGYLEALLGALVPSATILTPSEPSARGAQLSIRVPEAAARHAALAPFGVVGDVREPDILRFAPAPLYSTYHDAWRAATALATTADG